MILCWLDLETTGLDPDKGFILECAWTITDVHLVGDGKITTRLVTPSLASRWALATALPIVRTMHRESGLADELADDDLDKVLLADLEQELIGELVRFRDEDGDVRLAGASVHFDLGFIRKHMPELAGMLSHRIYDVSTLKVAAQGIGLVVDAVQNPHPHRAAYDVMEALAWATSYGNLTLAATRIDELRTIAAFQGGAQAFEAYIENLKAMGDPAQLVTIGGIIRALKKSAATFHDQADLATLHL